MDKNEKIIIAGGLAGAVAVATGVAVYLATKKPTIRTPHMTTPPIHTTYHTTVPKTTKPPHTKTIITHVTPPSNYYYITNPNNMSAIVEFMSTAGPTVYKAYSIPPKTTGKVPIPSGYQQMILSTLVDNAYDFPSFVPPPSPGSKWTIWNVAQLTKYTFVNDTPYTLYVNVVNPQILLEIFWAKPGQSVNFWASSGVGWYVYAYSGLSQVCSEQLGSNTTVVCKS